jgi:putative oxidoreductase
MNIKTGYAKLDNLLVTAGNSLQSVLLLMLRLFWGWQFFLTGKGKLMNLDRTAGFFESLNIPLPKLNAALAGTTEMAGGLLLLIGFGSRIITVPLMFVMVIAYATADIEAVRAIFSDPDKFTSAAPFLFLLTAVIIFCFGPGKLSLDALLKRNGTAK